MRRSLRFFRPPSAGFTLVELMITVAIVGILAAVAYPSFMESVRKSRRSDAVAALTRVQHAEERWRANNGTYAASFGADGLNLPTTSPDGHYSLAVSNNNASTYTVTATAQAGSPQIDDVKCRSLQVTMVNGGGTTAGMMQYGSTDSSGTTNVSTGNTCWIK